MMQMQMLILLLKLIFSVADDDADAVADDDAEDADDDDAGDDAAAVTVSQCY